MAYVPTPPPVVETVEALMQYLQEELQNISRSSVESLEVELRTASIAPKRPRNGMIVEADGVNWNPGFGAGLYVYRLGVWKFIA